MFTKWAFDKVWGCTYHQFQNCNGSNKKKWCKKKKCKKKIQKKKERQKEVVEYLNFNLGLLY